jgi:hypothetical protein
VRKLVLLTGVMNWCVMLGIIVAVVWLFPCRPLVAELLWIYPASEPEVVHIHCVSRFHDVVVYPANSRFVVHLHWCWWLCLRMAQHEFMCLSSRDSFSAVDVEGSDLCLRQWWHDPLVIWDIMRTAQLLEGIQSLLDTKKCPPALLCALISEELGSVTLSG